MITYQQYLSDELTKCQKLCQEAITSTITREVKEQLYSMAVAITDIQDAIKHAITLPSEIDLTVVQDTLQRFRETAPTKQQIQNAYKTIEKLAKLLTTKSTLY